MLSAAIFQPQQLLSQAYYFEGPGDIFEQNKKKQQNGFFDNIQSLCSKTNGSYVIKNFASHFFHI